MKIIHLLVSIVGLLFCSQDAAARFQPSFDLDGCVWKATHIIVVTEGDKIDGEVEVLESWKGDLKKGNRITVPELAAFASKESRAISQRLFKKEENLPECVTCSRMVLFLIQKQEKPDGDKPGKTKWLPADEAWKEMKVSVVWIEADRVFAFGQQVNPGPSQLISWGMKERDMKQEVEEILKVQTSLAAAIRQDDSTKLASAVLPLLRPDRLFVRRLVIKTLVETGPKCLPALRGILKDESLKMEKSDVIRAMAEVGGAEVGPELSELLKKELAFWKKEGPGLPKDWWNGAGIKSEETERLHDHYFMVHAVLHGLKETRHEGCRELVIEFRDFWRSLPQLAEFAQLHEYCDAILKELPRK